MTGFSQYNASSNVMNLKTLRNMYVYMIAHLLVLLVKVGYERKNASSRRLSAIYGIRMGWMGIWERK
jgi:hypothetical protein